MKPPLYLPLTVLYRRVKCRSGDYIETFIVASSSSHPDGRVLYHMIGVSWSYPESELHVTFEAALSTEIGS